MKVNVVRNVCRIIEGMEDATIEKKEHILVEDMKDGSKYALIHLDKNEIVYIADGEEEQ